MFDTYVSCHGGRLSATPKVRTPVPVGFRQPVPERLSDPHVGYAAETEGSVRVTPTSGGIGMGEVAVCPSEPGDLGGWYLSISGRAMVF